MISSQKAVRPRSLQSSTAGVIVLHPSATSLYSPSPSPLTLHQPSDCRDFSWGAKQKIGHKNAGNVWKGFSTQDHTRARKMLCRGTFWDHHYAPRLHRYLQVHEYRPSSSWGKSGSPTTKSDQSPKSRTRTEEKSEEDWYSRYQVQKKKQYDEFMKRMEEDPVAMLFGTRWAKWVDGAEAKMTKAFAFEPDCDPRRGTSVWEWDCKPHTSSAKRNEEVGRMKQPTNRTTNVESQDQEYEIDPITNRKVQEKDSRPDPSSVSDSPSISAVSKATETFSEQKGHQGIDIPVKRFIPSNAVSASANQSTTKDASPAGVSGQSSILMPKAAQGWLAQGGFGGQQRNQPKSPPMPEAESVKSKASVKRIEPALNGHVDSRATDSRELSHQVLQYELNENQAEDVDLLRSSDVRASAGLRGRPARESDSKKQARQRKLEEEYDSRAAHLQNQLDQELKQPLRESAKRTQWSEETGLESSNMRSSPPVSGLGRSHESKISSVERATEISKPFAAGKSVQPGQASTQAEISEKANKIKAQIVPLKVRLDAMKADYDALRQRWLDEKRRQEEKAAKKIKDIHEAEVKAQKVAMEAMEMRGVEGTGKRCAVPAHGSLVDAPSNNPRRLQSFLPGEGDMASNVHEFASRDRWYKKKAPHANDESNFKVQQLHNDRALLRELRGIYEYAYGTIDTTHRQPAGSESPKILASSESQVPTATTSSSASQKHARPSDPINTPSSSNITASPLAESSDTSQAPSSRVLQDDPTSPDSMAIVQRLFNALRQAQSLIYDHRTDLYQINHPSEPQLRSIGKSSDALAIIQRLFGELRQLQGAIQEQRNPEKPVTVFKEVLTANDREELIATKASPKLYTVQGVMTANDRSELIEDWKAPYPPTEASTDSAPVEPKPSTTEEPSTQLPSSAPAKQAPISNLPSDDRVRREEPVFSGSSRGNWQEARSKRATKKAKRDAKRSRKLRHMFLTGTITAACCYAVGVISEMMQ